MFSQGIDYIRLEASSNTRTTSISEEATCSATVEEATPDSGALDPSGDADPSDIVDSSDVTDPTDVTDLSGADVSVATSMYYNIGTNSQHAVRSEFAEEI